MSPGLCISQMICDAINGHVGDRILKFRGQRILRHAQQIAHVKVVEVDSNDSQWLRHRSKNPC